MAPSVVSVVEPPTLTFDSPLKSPVKSPLHSPLPKPQDPAKARYIANGWNDLPSSDWSSKIHHLEPEITREVDSYFLQHWPFKTEKDRKKFVAAGFTRVTCLYFPLANDDRIALASKLLTILFLIDGTFCSAHTLQHEDHRR